MGGRHRRGAAALVVLGATVLMGGGTCLGAIVVDFVYRDGVTESTVSHSPCSEPTS